MEGGDVLGESMGTMEADGTGSGVTFKSIWSLRVSYES